MYHGRLPTGAFLQKVCVHCNSLCYFCSSMTQTTVHIFFECSYAKLFQHNLTTKSTTINSQHNHTFTSLYWSNTWTNLRKRFFNNNLSWEAIFPFCFWHLWLTMNHNLSKNKRDLISVSNVRAKTTEFHVISLGDTTRKKVVIWLKWDPPPL